MEEIIQRICENVEYKNADKFRDLLYKNLKVSDEAEKSTYAVHDNLIFKFSDFFAGFRDFENELGKDKKYISAINALRAITEELGFEFEDNHLFVLYHLKDLGKFKIRESKLYSDLEKVWNGVYRPYKMEVNDLTYALKDLMRAKFIEYRKANISMNKTILVRFRTESPNRKKKK